MLEKIKHSITQLLLARPWLTLVLVVLIVGTLAGHLNKFRFDASAESLVLEGDKDFQYFRKISERYQSEDFLLVTFKPEKDLLSKESLTILDKLQNDLSGLPRVSSVISILDIPLLESPRTNLGDLAVGNINSLRNNPDIDKALVRKELSTSPFYRQLLTNEDNTITAIQVNLQRDQTMDEIIKRRDLLRMQKIEDSNWNDSLEQQLLAAENDYRTRSELLTNRQDELVSQARTILDNYRGDAKLFLGGVPMIASDMINFVKSDLVVFGSSIFVFIIITLLIIFRRFSWVILPLTSCAATVVAMLGLTSWMDWPMTVISSNFVALLLIITLSLNIHIIVRYRELLQANPDTDKKELVKETTRQMIAPCLFATMTTNVAFTSLIVSGIRPVIDFGKMMTMGVSMALIMTFLIMPAGLMLFKRPSLKAVYKNTVKDTHALAQDKDTQGFTTLFARFTDKHGIWVSIISGLVLVATLMGVNQLKVENRFIDYFKETTEIYQGMELIDQQLGGTIPLEIVLNMPSLDPLVTGKKSTGNVAFEQDFEDFSVDDEVDFSKDESELESDFMDEYDNEFDNEASDFRGSSSMVKDFTASPWFTLYGLEQIEKVHDYIDGLEQTGKVMSLATLSKILDIISPGYDDMQLALIQSKLPDSIKNTVMNPYVDLANDQTRIVVRVKETSRSLQRNELLNQIRYDLEHKLGFKPENYRLTGMLVLYNNMLQSLFRSQIMTLGFVFLCIMLMFWFLFRSLNLAILAIAPNLLAAGAVLGIMGLAGIPLDIMTVTIAAIAVGIGVDNTIHYVYRFKQEFARIKNYRETMYYCHGSTGKAMFYTSLTIIVGFSILALSNFNPSIYFGLLTAAAMLLALLGALILLPQLLILFKPLGKEVN